MLNPLKAFTVPITREVKCNGLSFPVLTWGSDGARPILLLHGFPQEPATWSQVAQALAEVGFQAYAPFQRGYVSSARPGARADYTFAYFVADAVGIADALGLEQFDVAGFGMGGVLAWMLAAACPTRIRSLTSLRYPHPAAFAHGIQFEPQQREKWQQLQQQFGSTDLEERAAAMLANNGSRLRAFLQSTALPQPFLDRYIQRLMVPGALIGAFSWERAINLEDFSNVPVVTAPTLLIWTEGPALARTTVAATRNYVRAPYEEILIPNVGNFILETASAIVIPLLRKHLFAN
jgi:pimeloyl-ACP methyl ester carboxylesterase